MKLSEAIRKGATMRPQGFRYLCDPNGGTCAMGAAADAVGILNHAKSEYTGPRPKEWRPVATRFLWSYPCGCDEVGLVQHAMVHLNNEHRWTREQIADWVETLEDPKAAA